MEFVETSDDSWVLVFDREDEAGFRTVFGVPCIDHGYSVRTVATTESIKPNFDGHTSYHITSDGLSSQTYDPKTRTWAHSSSVPVMVCEDGDTRLRRIEWIARQAELRQKFRALEDRLRWVEDQNGLERCW